MTLLSATNISMSLGGTRVLAGVDFSANAGEVIGLIGPNGAGKTTLLRVLAGLLRPATGRIHLYSRPEAEIDRRERARIVGYLPQEGDSHWAVTVETLVTMGRLPHLGHWRGPSAIDRAAVTRALETCDVARLANRLMPRLSGGERARVLLARVLAGEPKVILADEPVSGLDPAHQLDVMETLRGLAGAGASVTVVMHDLSLATRYCDRLVMISDGMVAADGPCASVLSPENLARCYRIRAHHGHVAGIPYVLPTERISRSPDRAAR